jgi:hypothetical protein
MAAQHIRFEDANAPADIVVGEKVQRVTTTSTVYVNELVWGQIVRFPGDAGPGNNVYGVVHLGSVLQTFGDLKEARDWCVLRLTPLAETRCEPKRQATILQVRQLLSQPPAGRERKKQDALVEAWQRWSEPRRESLRRLSLRAGTVCAVAACIFILWAWVWAPQIERNVGTPGQAVTLEATTTGSYIGRGSGVCASGAGQFTVTESEWTAAPVGAKWQANGDGPGIRGTMLDPETSQGSINVTVQIPEGSVSDRCRVRGVLVVDGLYAQPVAGTSRRTAKFQIASTRITTEPVSVIVMPSAMKDAESLVIDAHDSRMRVRRALAIFSVLGAIACFVFAGALETKK